jgi:hypothetical protein
MSTVTRKHVAYRILGDLLVALVAIAAVYVYLHFVVLPGAMAEFPRPDGLWQRAEVVVSFYLLLEWIALETGCFFLFLRSHFTRVLAAVAFANSVLFLLGSNRQWLLAPLFGAPVEPAGTTFMDFMRTEILGPLVVLSAIVVIKGILYAAALQWLPARRVFLGALYGNILALVVLFAFIKLFANSAG